MPDEVLPYLVPDPSATTLEAWQWWTETDWEPLPADLPEWDPTTTLHLRRTVHHDTNKVLADTRLDANTRLGWAVSWWSSTSGMREAITPVPLALGSGRATLDLVLAGERLGGTLSLTTALVLLEEVTKPLPGSPRRAGSTLVSHSTRLDLGTVSNRFPVQQVDFATTRLSPDASWHLQTTTDLDAPFLGAFVLLLNTRDRELTVAISRRRRDARQEALLQDLEQGVAGLLLELANSLRIELGQRVDWPDGSVGNVLNGTLRRGERYRPLPRASGPENLAVSRTMLDGATRAAGYGRVFR